ncbi:MAG TPA: type II toxin-antitoxin system VapC family toxin [Solirubrobacteraceae bacterium]|jgi:PIN domain nuclease of toxin-antitoxin system|nr:type II toxin-antitoxin system VapC family toxin [Solirubrobacteraceae bacterium]
MRVLLDAHALLWWLDADRRLSPAASRTIETADAPLVGAGTLVEIAVKRSIGKLPIDEDWPQQTREDGFGVLDIGWAHVTRLQELPFPQVGGTAHRDPFDRLLAAQALSEGLAIVTRDPALAAYGVATIW